MKVHATLGYIVSLILSNLGHVFRFRIVSRLTMRKPRVVYIFTVKMFHQEASVETIKLSFNNYIEQKNSVTCGLKSRIINF